MFDHHIDDDISARGIRLRAETNRMQSNVGIHTAPIIYTSEVPTYTSRFSTAPYNTSEMSTKPAMPMKSDVPVNQEHNSECNDRYSTAGEIHSDPNIGSMLAPHNDFSSATLIQLHNIRQNSDEDINYTDTASSDGSHPPSTTGAGGDLPKK
jgi:hypothetical protein